MNDDVYDNKCRQVISVPTDVTPRKPDEPEKWTLCDEFESRSADDDKARLDNCSIQVQNIPDAQLYIYIYPGTDRVSMTRNTYDRISKRALDYLTKSRGIDPRRIVLQKGSSRNKSTYQIYIVPPSAVPPVIQ